MPSEDSQMTRMIQREIARRNIDISRLDIKAMHGVVYLRGTIKKIRGHENLELRKELEIIHRNLRTKSGVRDVVLDVEIRD